MKYKTKFLYQRCLDAMFRFHVIPPNLIQRVGFPPLDLFSRGFFYTVCYHSSSYHRIQMKFSKRQKLPKNDNNLLKVSKKTNFFNKNRTKTLKFIINPLYVRSLDAMSGFHVIPPNSIQRGFAPLDLFL